MNSQSNMIYTFYLICIQERKHLLPKVFLGYWGNRVSALDWLIPTDFLPRPPFTVRCSYKDLMLRLLLCVRGWADEIWIRAPADLGELRVKWFAVWVSEKNKTCQSEPTFCFFCSMIACTGSRWVTNVCQVFWCARWRVRACVSAWHKHISSCTAAGCKWYHSVAIDEPGDLARQIETMWWKLSMSLVIFLILV